MLGLGDILLWCREKMDTKTARQAQWEQRESYKWCLGASNARQVLSAARMRTFIFDRDSDSYELFENLYRPEENDHFVLRMRHDRQVVYRGETPCQRAGACQSRRAWAATSWNFRRLTITLPAAVSASAGKNALPTSKCAVVPCR